MTSRRARTRAVGVAVALAASAPAAGARAQSFIDEIAVDPCGEARSLDANDATPEADRMRRACRLQRFEARLAAERQQELYATEQARDARVQAWFETSQPARVIRPIAVEAFFGDGLAAYGLALSWDALRHVQAGAWIGRRGVSFGDEVSSSGNIDYTRTAVGIGGRWMFGDSVFSPFVGGGLAIAWASVTANVFGGSQTTQITPGGPILVGPTQSFDTGKARANSFDGTGGVELAIQGFRMSLAYVYEYVFYTGANLDDMEQTPSNDLRVVWRDSLNHERNGVRFQVGYAF